MEHYRLSYYFENRLSDTLVEWGFGLNPYSQCMAYKIKEKQCTIIWQVDDLKISHMEKKVIKDIIRIWSINSEKQAHLHHHRESTGILGHDD